MITRSGAMIGAKRSSSAITNSQQPHTKKSKKSPDTQKPSNSSRKRRGNTQTIPQSLLERSASPPPISNSTIDDLPDLVLVEIFCRLPHNKVAFVCKLVSKRWRTLLSDPYFVCQFLRLQRDQQKPLLKSYVMVPHRDAKQKTLVLTLSPKPPHPVFEIETSISSILSFLPCFQGHDYADKEDDFDVVGIYNDLVLCAPNFSFQRDYYICNSYTKEWVRLPPTFSMGELLLPIGLVCDPYYNIKEDSTDIKLNAEYRCRVVRILPDGLPNIPRNEGFYVEIFSSETGEWREYRSSKEFCKQRRRFTSFSKCPGVACNGKLYWWNRDGNVFELDPFNITSNGDIICGFIDAPAEARSKDYKHIGVCRGRLRMCPDLVNGSGSHPIIIWELKENQVDGKPKWCLIFNQVSLSEMIQKQPFITHDQLQTSYFKIVGFHQNHGDIVFLQFNSVHSHPRCIFMCNLRRKTLEIATKIPFEKSPNEVYWWSSKGIHPYVIPWWPTPVPRKLDYHEEYFNVTVIGVDTFTVNVGSLTTVKQLKQELEKRQGPAQYKLYFDAQILQDDDKWLTGYGIKDKSEIYINW